MRLELVQGDIGHDTNRVGCPRVLDYGAYFLLDGRVVESAGDHETGSGREDLVDPREGPHCRRDAFVALETAEDPEDDLILRVSSSRQRRLEDTCRLVHVSHERARVTLHEHVTKCRAVHECHEARLDQPAGQRQSETVRLARSVELHRSQCPGRS